VLVLAAGAFVFVTTETLPIGLLPQIAGSLGVGVGAAGLLVTGYAAVVVLTAVPLTALAARLPRRGLVELLLVVFMASSGLAAVSGSYLVLLAARAAGALAHGVFWSVIGSLAARLLPASGAGASAPLATGGRATAVVFAGNSLAVVLGVPAGTLLGQHLGWRAAFLVLAALSAVLLAAAAALLPPLAAVGDNGLAALGGVARDRRLRAAVAVTGLVVLAQFTSYTYIVAVLRDVTAVSGTTVTAALLLFGVGGLAGNVLAGLLVDRDTRRGVLAVAAALAAVLAVLAAVAPIPAATIFVVTVWGGPAAAMSVSLQARVLRLAGASPDAASAFYVSVYNLGIGGGALLGSVLLPVTGLRGLPAAGAALAVVALLAQVAAPTDPRPASSRWQAPRRSAPGGGTPATDRTGNHTSEQGPTSDWPRPGGQH